MITTFKNTSKNQQENNLKIFQQKFKQAEENPTLFIVDFKCGEINGEPIRWNKTTIKRGKQTINGKVFSFQKCVLMKSVINICLSFALCQYWQLDSLVVIPILMDLYKCHSNHQTYKLPHATCARMERSDQMFLLQLLSLNYFDPVHRTSFWN